MAAPAAISTTKASGNPMITAFRPPDKDCHRQEANRSGCVPPATWLRFRSVGDTVSAVAVIGVLVLIVGWARIVASRRNLVVNSSSALAAARSLYTRWVSQEPAADAGGQ